MRVRELIEHLQACDPGALVVVNGYEGGFDDIETVEPVSLALNVYETEDYMGLHELVSEVRKYDPDKSWNLTNKPSDLDVYVSKLGGGHATLEGQEAVYIGKKQRRG